MRWWFAVGPARLYVRGDRDGGAVPWLYLRSLFAMGIGSGALGWLIGIPMLFWTLCFFMIDLIDQRVVYRTFWQDWLVAAGSIGFCLILGRLVATPIDAHVDTVLLLQIAISVLLFPLAARLCAMLAGDEEEA